MTPASAIRPPQPPRPWNRGRIHLPQPALGELYARHGVAWGRLLAPHKRGNPAGSVLADRQRKEA